ncbi:MULTISPECIES: RHS repeat-associated core domain-containing protein [Pseudomonas]|uniref:RHS repeat-associated core domain-containing protein n=1 Tax=Pseudomonas peradeniyensis TaxID=2745488 RepID=A0ABT2VA02_9PSED|nr:MULTISPECIES: RHS repeat-associated core domain-containing protein [Pseudomonas]MCU7238566.1 RHS repeat-associated core domain-containing protein [Pseudomonas peradeniyensis]MCU7279035.1 RHS repeat-associated core domain-containing protein [Pseudomonas peradeniyensis]
MSLYLPILDHQRSPFWGSNFSRAYTPYGATAVSDGPMLGFCGQPSDKVTGSYLLGNGHRCYSPGLFRFQSPDQLSPFGKGGINAYAYCGGDPVNRWDPSGQVIESGLNITLALFAARDAGKTVHQTNTSGRAIVAEQRHSTDPNVLNKVKPTLSRQIGETSAVVVPVVAAVGTGVSLATGGAAPALLGTVGTIAGVVALVFSKGAKRRENKLAKDEYYYLNHSTGQEANRVAAVFNDVKDRINQDISRGVWPSPDKNESSIDKSFNAVLEVGEELRNLA